MDKRLNLILQQLDTLPTLPAVALKVIEATGGSSSASARDVVQLISSDPALTARILQLVHRADFGAISAGEKLISIERAVTLLGFDAIRHAVLAVSVFQAFQGTASTAGSAFSRDEFWKHCVAVACCAEMLAIELRKHYTVASVDPSEAFVCGLLHDIGKVALDATLPKSFARVVEAADLLRGNIADLERQIVGIDHMVVGKRLAEKWMLPPTLREVIWLHGQSPEALPATVANARLINLITLADAIVREQHIGFSGNFTQSVSVDALLAAVGVTRENVQTVVANLVEQIEPRAKALGLGQSSSGELYQQALEQANKELGRVTDQLSSKNRRLAIRSKFFESLSEFHSALRPDAPTQTVLAAIGQTAVEALDCSSAAIFSLPPAHSFAEAVLVDDAGEVFEKTIVDHPTDASSPTRLTGDGPILTAGNDLEWLLQAVSPRLGHEHRFWICLETEGRCIGGVIWGAKEGESTRLGSQTQELTALSTGWALALRTSQIRDEARALSEQLAETNRQLQSAQAELLRKRTIVTVGEMAAGAAHEMNNPLMVISGRSQLLASQLSDPKQKAMAHLVHEQSHRLSQIITELMDFARPESPKPVVTDLADLVQRILHEAKAKPERADSVRVELTLTDVPAVLVDPNQVGAAVAEIVDNAFDATTSDSGESKGQVDIHAAFNPHRWSVVLTIADNGCGMDEATLRRAFDPFFSHKPAGRRRGMGLAKAQRWIESSGGSVRLESHPGRGTRAVILLPAVREEVKSVSPESSKRLKA